MWANDWHPAAVALARKDAAMAGVLNDVSFHHGDAKDWTPITAAAAGPSAAAFAAALVVSNPPWDLRLQGADDAWASLGTFLRREASSRSSPGGGENRGGEAWLLCGNPEATKALRMKAAAKVCARKMSWGVVRYMIKRRPKGVNACARSGEGIEVA